MRKRLVVSKFSVTFTIGKNHYPKTCNYLYIKTIKL